MENIKMETDLKLETIFISLNKDNVNLLDDILKLKELSLVDKTTVNKYIAIVNQTGTTPNIEILKREFPDLYFDDVIPLKEEEILDYIRLYIGNQKNLSKARLLLEMSNKVRTNGLTEDIILALNDITRDNATTITHKDISDKLIEVYNSKISDNGISTGIKDIDNDTGGLQPGAMTVLFGYTGSGKTTWAINIAYNAIFSGKNVLYVSLEVVKDHIYFDLISKHSCNSKFTKKLKHSELKRKKLKEEDYNYFKDIVYPDFLKATGKIYVVDETELDSYSTYTLLGKFNEIDKLATKETGHGIDLLVLDHAQLLKFNTSMSQIGNETSLTNAYVSFIRQQCLNWCKSGRPIAGLMLSQASRTGWQEADKDNGRYKLTGLAESNELERGASLVLSIYSSTSLKDMKEVKVQILKNRDGNIWEEPREVRCDFQYYDMGKDDSSLDISGASPIDISDNLFNDDFVSLEDINNIDLDL